MEGRWKYFIATAFLLTAAVLRLASSTPIALVHDAIGPYLGLELPFIFVGALLWTGFMSEGRWGLAVIVAALATAGYYVLTTGIGFI